MRGSAFPSLFAVLVLSATAFAQKVPPVENLLPKSTKGILSVPNVTTLLNKWDLTQVGKLAKEPAMKAFAEDLRKQLEDKLNQGGVRLRLQLSDLKGLSSGELCLATIQPNNDPKQHAAALFVDVTGHLEEAKKLLARIDQELIREGARKATAPVGGVEITAYTLAKRRGEVETRRAFYFLRDNRLVATNNEAVAKAMAERFDKPADDCLANLPAFKEVMSRCQAASGKAVPEIRWFVEPFGWAETVRAAAGGRKKRGTDMLKVLSNQGFAAIKGVGGHVFLMLDDLELVHRTCVYAPPVKKTAEKYELAARVLSFPNAPQPTPQTWVPADVTNYVSFHWRIKEVFEFAKTLVDEAAGAPIWDDVLTSLRDDPNGPRIDIRKDLIPHLGQRVTFFTDYRQPITTTCERWLAAVEVTDAAAVAKLLNKAMQADPLAKKRMIGGQLVWELVEEEGAAGVEKVKVAAPGFGGAKDEDEDEQQINPLIKHAAMTVANGHLMVTSHIDFMEQVLTKTGKSPGLDAAKDYLAVQAALKKLGASNNSLQLFLRTDKGNHPTYELIRQGKMPEAETLFGNLLNKLYASEEQGVIREQQIKGDKMPPFEKVRGSMGPGGLFSTSGDDGWMVTGCLLKK